jgi:hypothetical protein
LIRQSLCHRFAERILFGGRDVLPGFTYPLMPLFA